MYREERFNGFSHLIGAILAVAGTVVLVASSALYHDAWKVVSSVIHDTTPALLYTISTLYHSLRGPAESLFQRLDYCVICLMIAGSYTSSALVTLRGPWGWALFGINWALTAIGVVQELRINHRTHLLSLLICIVTGWLVLTVVGSLAATPPTPGLWWVVAGGVLYTIGTAFSLFDKKVRHFHGIWRLFISAGSARQLASILLYMD